MITVVNQITALLFLVFFAPMNLWAVIISIRAQRHYPAAGLRAQAVRLITSSYAASALALLSFCYLMGVQLPGGLSQLILVSGVVSGAMPGVLFVFRYYQLRGDR